MLNAITINVVIIDNDIAEIDPDAQPDCFVRILDRRLYGDGTVYGVDDAGKFDQCPVAHQLDDASLELGDLWVEQARAMPLQLRQGSVFVTGHHLRIADNISRKYGGQPAFHVGPSKHKD